MPDPEIEAMASIANALAALDDESARSRILRWAADKYGVPLTPSGTQSTATRQVQLTGGADERVDDVEDQLNGSSATSGNSAANCKTRFQHFAELFNAVNPRTEVEKAITAGFWVQECRGQATWQAYELNKELKNLGHYISHITTALAGGMETKPATVLQIKKAGTSRQGRKTYKLSTHGLNLVRSRIASQ